MPGIANDGSEDFPNDLALDIKPAGGSVPIPAASMNLTASVRVRLEVEVTVGTYGGNSTFASVHAQAIQEAKQCLKNGVNGQRIRVVGEPIALHVVMKGE